MSKKDTEKLVNRAKELSSDDDYIRLFDKEENYNSVPGAGGGDVSARLGRDALHRALCPARLRRALPRRAADRPVQRHGAL